MEILNIIYLLFFLIFILKIDFIFFYIKICVKMNSSDTLSGLFTGLLTSLLFNPIDRFIFNRCICNEPLIKKHILNDLFKGSMHTIATRCITSGLYFSFIDHYDNRNKADIALISALLCSITNPLQLIKYHCWYHNTTSSTTIKMIYQSFGIRGFAIGAIPLIGRDFIFNYIYLSHKKKDDHFNNLLTISGALVISSPFNLIKNKKYATNETLTSIIKNFKFKQLGAGMMICRSCLSFYSSQLIYDHFKQII